MIDLLEEIADEIRVRADKCREVGAGDHAAALTWAASRIDERLRERMDEEVTLREAARLGGYSYDHLLDLVQREELKAVKVRRKWMVRRGDIPRRVGLDPTPRAKSKVVAAALAGRP